MKTLIIVSLEPLQSRYTSQWFDYLPKYFQDNLSDFEVIQVNGDTNSGIPTNGAFLDFESTNMWKNEQANKIMKMIKSGSISSGDYILYTDAWNPTIPEVKYVIELLKLNIKLGGLWHSGSYDKWDFLGRLIGPKPWITDLETSFFWCLDHNYFATNFHANLFCNNRLNDSSLGWIESGKIILTGWPMDYMNDILRPYNKPADKENIILFPHRLAPEKQLDIFKDLAASMPEYQWIVCQEQKLSKEEYHKLLGKSKMVFSASLQETLGISSCCEATLCGSFPLSPNHLSYSEILAEYNFTYPASWILDFNKYLRHKDSLISTIKQVMKMNDISRHYCIKKYVDEQMPQFFSGENIVKTIRNS